MNVKEFLKTLPIAKVYNVLKLTASKIVGSTKVYAKLFRDNAKPKLERCAPIRIDIDGMFRKA